MFSLNDEPKAVRTQKNRRFQTASKNRRHDACGLPFALQGSRGMPPKPCVSSSPNIMFIFWTA
ncbi:predicted protein [Neisseria gonorrhoeae PID332]|nr:predicted protein [Neisseria gonorrhoeae PID332]